MRTMTVLVAHRQAMVAEGLVAGLSEWRGLVPIGSVTTAEEAERAGMRVDAVALDEYLPGANDAAKRLRASGVRVVMIGGADQSEGEARVPLSAPIAALARILVPHLPRHQLRPSRLTAREREILRLIGHGLAGKQVANHLGISHKTVEHHKTRIFSKLGVANQAAAVRIAAEEELSGAGA